MKQPVWIPKEVVLLTHDLLLAEHGGQPGLRDEGLLDTALARPQQLLSYGDPDLFGLAAAYVFGIIRNHPFLDGNKRTAFMVGFDFLYQNGKLLSAPEPQAAQMVVDLAAKKITEEEFAIWLQENSKRKPKEKP
ncbi:MAG: type II toxin-antitoxin system death-on-curing family toxin [Nitrospinales bacterium]